MQPTVVVWADWTLHPWRHNSSNVGAVTAAMRDTTRVMSGVSLRAKLDTTLVIAITGVGTTDRSRATPRTSIYKCVTFDFKR